jgi:hypothetical protein
MIIYRNTSAYQAIQQQNTKLPHENSSSINTEQQINTAIDSVSISTQGYAAFSAEQLNKVYQAGEVMQVNDNRNKNYQAVNLGEFMKNVNQRLLDQRTGVDRDKLNEINALMEEIADNPNLSDKEKEQLLAALEEERMALFKEANERMIEADKEKLNSAENQMV